MSIVIWMTGLSGSGKSTIAQGAQELLRREGLRTELLDGDAVRQTTSKHLGFSRSDIAENNRLLGEMARQGRKENEVVFVVAISPLDAVRKSERSAIGEGFYLVYVKASLEEVERRDPKGLYARSGEEMIGVSRERPYEVPEDADLVLDTQRRPAQDLASALAGFIRQRLKPRKEVPA